MEQQIKERLVGAGVLVLLGVLLIPEFLSGPADQSEDPDSSIALPAGEDQEMRSHTIRLDQKEPRDRPPVAHAVAESAESRPKSDPVIEKPAPKPDDSDVPKAADAQASKPQPAPVKAETTTPPKTETQPSPGAWAVQVGSFSSAENASRLASTIESMGYKSFVTQIVVSGKTHHRVRIGPVATREEAQKIAAELQEQGQQAAVVTQP